MIDSHAHVHDRAFDADRCEMLARARERGVTGIITIGCDVADSQRALEVATSFDLYCSAGIHPHEAKTAPDDLAQTFADLLSSPRLVAIGETGLDYYYDYSPRDVQQDVLRRHIALAKQRELPLIFHHRDAFADFSTILRETLNGQPGVVHCFTGDRVQAQTYTEEFGLLLGIGGVVTFKNAHELREAVTFAGPQRCILETDCPYLAPIPHRGKRNEPAFVADTAQFLSTLWNIPVEDVRAITTENARRLFAI